MANDGKWMFGATSKADLNQPLNVKKTYFNRDLPEDFSEGGLQIGTPRDDTRSRRNDAAAYKAQLDFDKSTRASDNLPDARRRSAYDYQKPQFEEDDHPLGRSTMGAFGEAPAGLVPSPSKSLAAANKRAEIEKANRFNIITQMEADSQRENFPSARNNADLLVGVPLSGRTDDGILDIGASAADQRSIAKDKARQYRAQLEADEANFGTTRQAKSPYLTGNRDNYTQMNTDPSAVRINQTGVTGFNVSNGPSLDMTPSMKSLHFDVKREKQAAYRAQLGKQQAETAQFKNAKDAQELHHVYQGLPYMTENAK